MAAKVPGRMNIRFLGTGGPFGAGGRFQACILVDSGDRRLLLDCGASSLIAMAQHGIDPTSIDTILVSHLHGDHFGGIPYFLLEADIGPRQGAPHGQRTSTLTIAGPPGIEARVGQASDALFRGLGSRRFPFSVEFLSWTDRQPSRAGPALVTPFAVPHDPASSPFALRVEFAGRVIAYSGDTSWTESLLEVAKNADLFICEAFSFDRELPIHLSFQRIAAERARLTSNRLILTHLGPEMVSRLDQIDIECAHDGLLISL
jgi:ribonuclease BN (tRNA processing enzyme)